MRVNCYDFGLWNNFSSNNSCNIKIKIVTKKKIVVLGSGISGIGAAILAKKKGYDVFVSDLEKLVKNKIILDNNKIEYEEFQHSECNIKNANEVVKSPGISPKEKIIKYIEQKNTYNF